MKAHIVGGGFGGLAAAASLILNADMSGPDITIYEADEKLGGGFFLAGDAKSGYNLPGSIFDREFRCALGLLAKIPTHAYSNINVAEQFLTFNKEHPFVDQTHIVDRNLRRMHDQRYGLNLSDGLRLAKLSLTREASLDGQRIKDWFSPSWRVWSFARNFGLGDETEGLHFVCVLSFGEEFREDVGLVGIQEKFRKALA